MILHIRSHSWCIVPSGMSIARKRIRQLLPIITTNPAGCSENANMPLRGLFYLAAEYQRLVQSRKWIFTGSHFLLPLPGISSCTMRLK